MRRGKTHTHTRARVESQQPPWPPSTPARLMITETRLVRGNLVKDETEEATQANKELTSPRRR